MANPLQGVSPLYGTLHAPSMSIPAGSIASGVRFEAVKGGHNVNPHGLSTSVSLTSRAVRSTAAGDPIGPVRTKAQKKRAAGVIMREFAAGNLHSGKGGKVVTNRKQAIAIMLSQTHQGRAGRGRR